MPGPEDYAYQQDLQLVLPEFRVPLQLYRSDGIWPTEHPVLMLLLSGNLARATTLFNQLDTQTTIAGTVIFVENHIPDIAWGTTLAMLRWQVVKGAKGRKPR